MATKNMTWGNSSTTVNVSANGNIVGANIRGKGNSSTPVYFDANGVAQPCDDIAGGAEEFTGTQAQYNAALASGGIKEGMIVNITDDDDMGTAYYTAAECNAKFLEKVNLPDAYTKFEADNKFLTADDIENKADTSQLYSFLNKSGGNQTILSYGNPSGASVRNIHISDAEPVASQGVNGDIWIVIG